MNAAAIFIASRARSRLILSAALALFIGWLFSLAWYFYRGGVGLSWGYAVIDIVLAAFFWRLSSGRQFPRPLFYGHTALIFYYSYVTLFGAATWWISAFINRAFEIMILYVAGCALYRIRALGRAKKRAH